MEAVSRSSGRGGFPFIYLRKKLPSAIIERMGEAGAGAAVVAVCTQVRPCARRRGATFLVVIFANTYDSVIKSNYILMIEVFRLSVPC